MVLLVVHLPALMSGALLREPRQDMRRMVPLALLLSWLGLTGCAPSSPTEASPELTYIRMTAEPDAQPARSIEGCAPPARWPQLRGPSKGFALPLAEA